MEKELLAYVVAAGSLRARLIIIGLACMFTVWQLYIFVWVPLHAESVLPAGLTSVRPQLDVDTLAKIQVARAQRLQHVPASFSQADQYFPIPASPAP